MPLTYLGPRCSRKGCLRPEWKQGLCHDCWRLAKLFGKDPRMFAYEPMHAYRDERDAPALPWEEWQREAEARGMTVADLLSADPPRPPGGQAEG